MKSGKVLIIEDDSSIAELLSFHLKDLGLTPEIRSNGKEGLSLALSVKFDLIVLDLMLPGIDGLEILKEIRKVDKNVPILVLTLKADIVDKVVGFELGADDYLAKPFSVHELIARIKALLRRSAPSEDSNSRSGDSEEILIGDILINVTKRRVTVRDVQVELTPKLFDLLVYLARHPGRPFSRSDLISAVWGYNHEGYEHTVDTHVSRLRTSIEPNPSKPRYVITVWGVGYRFAEKSELEGRSS